MSFIKKGGILLMFLSLLFFPDITIAGSKEGLCLWYERLLPVLFPGMIFGGMMKRTGVSDWIIQKTYPILRLLFPCSYSALFVIFTGFFCGYPMAAIQADKAWQRGEITNEEFHYCMSVSNLPGPVFLTGYVLKDSSHAFPYLAVFYGSAILVSQIARICFLPGNKRGNELSQREQQPFFLAFQEEIYQAAASLIQIAAILMVCSMLVNLFALWTPGHILDYFAGFLEMTTGIRRLSESNFEYYELSAFFLAGFGGLSVMLQIFTVAESAIKNTGYSAAEYLVFKTLFLFLFLFGTQMIILR